MIYDRDGHELADIPLSEKQTNILATDGAEITVIYHTPQMLRSVLGERNGSFTLRRNGEQIVADEPTIFQEYVNLQKAIAAAREND